MTLLEICEEKFPHIQWNDDKSSNCIIGIDGHSSTFMVSQSDNVSKLNIMIEDIVIDLSFAPQCEKIDGLESLFEKFHHVCQRLISQETVKLESNSEKEGDDGVNSTSQEPQKSLPSLLTSKSKTMEDLKRKIQKKF